MAHCSVVTVGSYQLMTAQLAHSFPNKPAHQPFFLNYARVSPSPKPQETKNANVMAHTVYFSIIHQEDKLLEAMYIRKPIHFSLVKKWQMVFLPELSSVFVTQPVTSIKVFSTIIQRLCAILTKLHNS
jgi:hypothetical protein